MSLPETIGFCVLLVGAVAFSAKLSIEGEPIDVMALICCCVAVGFMGAKL